MAVVFPGSLRSKRFGKAFRTFDALFSTQAISLGAAVSCSMLIRTIFVWVTHAVEPNILSLLLQSLRRIAIQIQYIF